MTDRDNAPPTAERGQHDEIEERDIPGKGRTYAVVQQKWVIDTYSERGRLGRGRYENEAHYKAASRLCRLIEATDAGSPKSCLVHLERIDGRGGPNDHGASSQDEMRRLRLHMGDALYDCAHKVAFLNWSADAWAKARGITRTSVGLEFLRAALYEANRFWKEWDHHHGTI